MAVTIDGTSGITTPGVTDSGALSVSGATTLSTGVLNIGSGQFYKDTSGNVGIGTSSPSEKLDIQSATGSVRIKSTTGTNAAYLYAQNTGGDFFFGKENSAGTTFGTGTAYAASLYVGGAYPLTFSINATERMRLDASGNLGLGVTPSGWSLAGGNALQSTAGSIASYGTGQFLSVANAYYSSGWKYVNSSLYATQYQQASGQHVWYTAPSGTAGNAISFTQAMMLDASGNLLLGTTSSGNKLNVNGDAVLLANGKMKFADAGNNYVATIQNSGAANSSQLEFLTGATPTERMRLDSSGNLLVGNTAVSGNNALLEVRKNSGNIAYFYNNAGTGVYLAAGNNSWTAASDERLKDIIEPIENAVTKVGSLRAVIGKYKTDEADTRRAFLIAQDVQAVLPEAVDASDPDQLGVQYTDTIPLLVAAIKELTARLEALENK